nr:retrovirus-related Pol polyprotein from transposon TNT 1-94 [Tanacetum cinerariifolium]
MTTEGSSFGQPNIPKFNGDHDHWSLLMENLLRSKEYWFVVENGIPEEGENQTPAQKKNLEDMKLKDLKAKNYLFSSIDKSILKTITKKETSKQLWDSMKMRYQGNVRVQRAQLNRLRRDFEILAMKTGESVTKCPTEVFGGTPSGTRHSTLEEQTDTNEGKRQVSLRDPPNTSLGYGFH